MKRDLVVIAAQQRSGTSVFGSLLGRSVLMHSFHEVFHPNGLGNNANFQTFLKLEAEAGRLNFAPTDKDRVALFQAYETHLRSLTEKKIPILDIKYNSWHHFNESWQSLGAPPLLVPIMKIRNAAILHLMRKDVLAQALSQELAKSRGVWHSIDHGSDKLPTFMRFDPFRIFNVIRDSIVQTEQFRLFFKGYDGYREIFYEDMIAQNCLSESTRHTVSEVIGFDVEDVGESDFRKVSPAVESFVENLEEIRAYLRNAGFGHVVETHERLQQTA